MEPQVVLLTDVSDLIDGVKCTVHGRAGCGIHEQWHVTLEIDQTQQGHFLKTRKKQKQKDAKRRKKRENENEEDTDLLFSINDLGL